MNYQELRDRSIKISVRIADLKGEAKIYRKRLDETVLTIEALKAHKILVEKVICEKEFPQLAKESDNAQEKAEDIPF